MGIVSLIIAGIMYLFGLGADANTLQGMDLYVQNVATVETAFFKFSLILWAIALGLLYWAWTQRQKIIDKVKATYLKIWEIRLEHGWAGIVLMSMSGFLYTALLMYGGLFVLGLLALPAFEWLSSLLAQQAALAWTPEGITPGFLFYAFLWFLLIGG